MQICVFCIIMISLYYATICSCRNLHSIVYSSLPCPMWCYMVCNFPIVFVGCHIWNQMTWLPITFVHIFGNDFKVCASLGTFEELPLSWHCSSLVANQYKSTMAINILEYLTQFIWYTQCECQISLTKNSSW